jgi:hypothetical protein
MKAQRVGILVVIVGLILVALDCGKNDAPTAPTQTAPASQLAAVPASVIVAAGAVQTVKVSGGTPPYAIAASPSSIANVALDNADSLSTILRITGITVASAPTSVIVKDNSPSTPKTVTVPISVR